MSRVGNPYDNAKAESFMGTLKREEVNGSAYRDAADARARLGEFIEQVYNRQRLHSALDYKPPVEYEDLLPRLKRAISPLQSRSTRTVPDSRVSLIGCSPSLIRQDPNRILRVARHQNDIQTSRHSSVGEASGRGYGKALSDHTRKVACLALSRCIVLPESFRGFDVGRGIPRDGQDDIRRRGRAAPGVGTSAGSLSRRR
jgi:hypothetical protein